MHVIGGVIKDTVLGTLNGSRHDSAASVAAEMATGRRKATIINPDKRKAAHAAFSAACELLSTNLPSGIVQSSRLMDVARHASKKIKTHTSFALAGPLGLYALECAASNLPSTIHHTLARLLQACAMLWCKVVYREGLHVLQALVAEAVNMVEAFLPACELDIKIHELMHLPELVRDWGE
jgi:hypothetical protein